MRPKKVVMVVIDGLTPSMLEAAVDSDRTPALSFLARHGRYRRAVTTFPSLTPVCLTSLATGAHPDVHHIPHLVWYRRAERRVIEYGSSFGALRAAGMTRSFADAIFNMNENHLSPAAVTIYEALEDAGLTAAAIDITCYRGRTRHPPILRGIKRAAFGPRRFFYFNLFESDVTGAPVAVFGRSQGSVDAYAAAVGRWLVTRDGFDFLAYYLPDYDFASHAQGPDEAHAALARSDAAVAALLEAAGGPDEFLERYAVVLCSDHGQTGVEHAARLQRSFARVPGTVVTASNRAGMVYRLEDAKESVRQLAVRLDNEPAAETALFLEGEEAIARREAAELRFVPDGDRWRTSGDKSIMSGYPDGLARAWAALHNPNAGDLLVSAAPGYEFADLGGRHHAGGGSHGSLAAGDSEVPMLTLGLETTPEAIVEVAPAVLRHFGVVPPHRGEAGPAQAA